MADNLFSFTVLKLTESVICRHLRSRRVDFASRNPLFHRVNLSLTWRGPHRCLSKPFSRSMTYDFKPRSTTLKVDPAELPNWLLEEDDDYMAFDKPGWLVCHPSKDGPWSSLVGAVKEWKQMDISHLVSRLDRETSGIILIAKHYDAASAA